MSINTIIKNRGIGEVMHFTTENGLLGVLDKRVVLSRHLLPADDRLEFILKLNAPNVLDLEWDNYVNLSISRINSYFFRSSQNWHDKVSWRILSFHPDILSHEGVYFTTTNNAYHDFVQRANGLEGLLALFADSIIGLRGRRFDRRHTTPLSCPTDIQAEVLYPGQLSTEYLQRIYVRNGEDVDLVRGQISATSHPDVSVIIDPSKFLI